MNAASRFLRIVRSVAREVVFTTHTPVPAGHDRFSAALVEEHLGPLRDALGLSLPDLMALGRERPDDPHEEFCMTVLGLKLARRTNAVSALHGEVSRAMWTGLYPGRAEDDVPIGHVTNGVHVPTWLAPQMARLYDRHLGVGWRQQSGEARTWDGIEQIDDEGGAFEVEVEVALEADELADADGDFAGEDAAGCARVGGDDAELDELFDEGDVDAGPGGDVLDAVQGELGHPPSSGRGLSLERVAQRSRSRSSTVRVSSTTPR